MYNFIDDSHSYEEPGKNFEEPEVLCRIFQLIIEEDYTNISKSFIYIKKFYP
jgi:hypothetical protein